MLYIYMLNTHGIIKIVGVQSCQLSCIQAPAHSLTPTQISRQNIRFLTKQIFFQLQEDVKIFSVYQTLLEDSHNQISLPDQPHPVLDDD